MTKVVRLALVGLLVVLVLAAAPASAQTPQWADQCLVGDWEYNGPIAVVGGVAANEGTLTLSIAPGGQAGFTLDSQSLPDHLYTFTGTGTAQIAVLGTVLNGEGSLLWTNFEFVGNAPIGPVPSQENSYSCNTDALTVTVPSTITVEARPLTFKRTSTPPTEYNLDEVVKGQGSVESTVVGPGGVAVRYPSDFVCPQVCSDTFWLSPGAGPITLLALRTGSWFMGWSGPCAPLAPISADLGNVLEERQCRLEGDGGVVTATFGHRLTVEKLGTGRGQGSVTSPPENVSPIGPIDCGPLCNSAFGEPVTLTATPGSAVFLSWGEACADSPLSLSCTLDMGQDESVTATFGYKLTVTKQGTGRNQGTVTSPEGTLAPVGERAIDCGPLCNSAFGEPVTLTETPGSAVFLGWGEACADSPLSLSCTLEMTQNASVTATFGHRLMVMIKGVGRVTGQTTEPSIADGFSGLSRIACPATNCSAFFAQGATLTATAVRGTRYTFSDWRGCATIASNLTCIVPMTRGTSVTAEFNRAKKPGSCQEGPRPDKFCTRGDRLPVTAQQVCEPGWARMVRNQMSSTLAANVYKEYGILRPPPVKYGATPDNGIGPYEIDHLIPLELGGSNSILNLWPQAETPFPGYAVKDELENMLHYLVCLHLRDPARGMSLSRAQGLMLATYHPV